MRIKKYVLGSLSYTHFFFFLVVLGLELGLQLAWQVLHHLTYTSSPFGFSFCFSDRVSCFLPGLASDLGPPTFAAQIAMITGMHHPA
jgi:hypothetical protein